MRRVVLVVLLLAVACGAPATRDPVALRVRASAVPSPTPMPSPTPDPTPAPTPKPTAKPKPKPVAATRAPKPATPDLTAFRGHGAWVDVFDFSDEPGTIVPAVRDISAKGARVLYLETSRYAAPVDVQFPRAIAAALDEAKRLGLRVVAWYPPDFADPARDLRRSLAAIRFTTGRGNRFDAFAADIEYKSGVPDHAERSARAVEYSRQLRAAAGPAYPLAIIVIPPSSLEINPGRWENFPWRQLAPYYDVFMPMNYWTGRKADVATASDLTAYNTTKARELSGRPVHTIGGLAEHTDAAQATAYVDAALASGSIGGGLYDYRTTKRPELWPILARLNR